ncbi:MAG TPA: ribbon-helix-helix protein, CopG family [Candidatus Nanoarchaeia archaeon]|nr:ribbon-helix-helix protein, CopG family [Candidatus Nanoarchaeia archaeon]
MSESTTIRVSKKTAETLDQLREKIGAQSIDEAIQTLVKQRRKATLDRTFGVDRNRIKPFTEDDRGEDRD